MGEEIGVSITLNGVEWIPLGTFQYFEPEVDWIGIAPPFQELQEWIDIEEKNLHSLSP